ncbi:MAG TPA: Do family serine endopeptidase [Candidatus Acidoferrales bacterium]|nr:Do family serine endopeptidase [Candidatus Acidoferrales bacterium]
MGKQMGEIFGWARQRKMLFTLLVMATLGIGVLIGSIGSGRVAAMRDQGAVAPLAVPNPVQLSGSFAAIVKQDSPAVVNIATTQVIDRRARQRVHPGPDQPGQNDPGDFFNYFFQFPDQGPVAERSLGSGVIVDEKGFILTNQHVIKDATKIQVKLPGDTTIYSAKVIGSDDETDLAVIKIDAQKHLPTARMGNSEAVQVGDWALAFGSPFGLEATVTAGIISAKERSLPGSQQFQRFIQTDAAINPGNSGGPLVNLAGEVIGINTAIYTSSRGYEGVGFALPSNTAIKTYNQLVTHGKVTRGSIGITFNEDRSNNPVLLKELGVEHGIVIERVEPGSPADKAGLKTGDVVTSVNGKPVLTGNDLVNPIVDTPIGDSVQITYMREKQNHQATVGVADRTKLFPRTAQANVDQSEEEGATDFGLHVEDITPELQQRLGLDGASGVIVTQIEPASFGEDVGFLRGDVIQEVNHQPVQNLRDWRRLSGRLKPGENVIFKVRRGGPGSAGPLTVPLAGVVPQPDK